MEHNYTVLLQSKHFRPLRIGLKASSWTELFRRLKKEYLIADYTVKSAVRRPR